jgi:hypothetical protein
MPKKPFRLPLWFAIPAWTAVIVTIIIASKPIPKEKDPRTAREKRINAEDQLRQERLQRAVQDELIRIDQKNHQSYFFLTAQVNSRADGFTYSYD